MKRNNKQIKIGQKLQAARKSCNLTQEQVSEKLDCAPRYVGLLETDKTNSSVPIILELCSLYGITPDYLYSDYIQANHLQDLSKIIGYFKLNDEHKAIIENNIAFLNKLESDKN